MSATAEHKSSELGVSARTLADFRNGAGEMLSNAGSGESSEGQGGWCGRGRARRAPQGMQERPLDLSKSPWAALAPAPASAAPAQRRSSQRAVLPCGVCGKSFDRPSLLKRHTRTHTGEKPHVCDVCSKGFSTSSSLNTHRRIHSGEKPHECQTCGKRFTASSNLYYHRMTHTKEKPHKCVECDKSFPTPGDLKAHRYIHTGSWPYRCVVCNRGFSKHTNLRNHAFLHTGDRPHPCTLCGKKFALACNLRAHTKTHHHEHVAGLAAPAQTPHAQSSVAQLSRPRAGVKSPNTINRQFEYHESNHLIYHRAERPKIKPEPKSPDPHPGDQQPNFTDLLANLAAPASSMSLLEDFWMKQVAFQSHGQHCSLNGHQQFAFLPSLQPPLMASLSLVELQTLLFVQANMAGYFKHGPLDGALDGAKMRQSSQIN